MASLGELSFALGLDSKKFDDAIKIAKKKIAELGTDVSINVNVDAEKVAKQIQAELDKIQDEQKKLLETISGLSAIEAKEQLKEMMKDEAVAEAMVISREIVEEAKMSANQEAKKIQ